MSQPLRIDYVSDVVCPWCALGLLSLRQAMLRVPAAQIQFHCQPFELNPDMPSAGEDTFALLQRRYGMTRDQYQQSQEVLRQRGEELGFLFSSGNRRIHNTLAAHRLLAWAEPSGQQLALKQTLFKAHFSDELNINNHDQLIKLVQQVGLDPDAAKSVLESNQFAKEVRDREAFYRAQGIDGVPAIIFNERDLLQGAQPPEVFEQAIRQLSN